MARKRTWHLEDIKAELRKKHGTLSALSSAWGLHSTTLSNIISKPGQSVRVERMIADAIGVHPHELWPSRFNADGTPISFRVSRTPTAPLPAGQRQKRAVA